MGPVKVKAALLTIVLAQGAAVMPATAQYPTYRPARPTFSPYLQLFQVNPGYLPNYHTYVRPNIYQDAVNRQLSESISRNQQSIDRQREALQNFSETQLSVQPAGSRGTGVHGRFRNYSHYYSRSRNR